MENIRERKSERGAKVAKKKGVRCNSERVCSTWKTARACHRVFDTFSATEGSAGNGVSSPGHFLGCLGRSFLTKTRVHGTSRLSRPLFTYLGICLFNSFCTVYGGPRALMHRRLTALHLLAQCRLAPGRVRQSGAQHVLQVE